MAKFSVIYYSYELKVKFKLIYLWILIVLSFRGFFPKGSLAGSQYLHLVTVALGWSLLCTTWCRNRILRTQNRFWLMHPWNVSYPGAWRAQPVEAEFWSLRSLCASWFPLGQVQRNHLRWPDQVCMKLTTIVVLFRFSKLHFILLKMRVMIASLLGSKKRKWEMQSTSHWHVQSRWFCVTVTWEHHHLTSLNGVDVRLVFLRHFTQKTVTKYSCREQKRLSTSEWRIKGRKDSEDRQVNRELAGVWHTDIMIRGFKWIRPHWLN